MSLTRYKLASNLVRLVVAGLLLGACDQQGSDDANSVEPVDPRLSVYAVNYPLAYFAARIGGNAVRVTLPVPAGADPADWQPSPATIIEFQQADLVLLNGAGYAAWVETAALPNNRLVDTSRSFLDRLIHLDDPTHSHGPEGSHSHGAVASHTWLDPSLAMEQARAILDALITYRPDQEAEFRAHFTLLARDLEMLDADLKAAFAVLEDQPVLFSHPVFQYLARRFVSNARSLDWEPNAVPDAGTLSELRDVLAEFPARILIWEQEPFAITVGLLEAEGLRSIAFATGANRPAEGDYLGLMRWNLLNLQKVQPADRAAPKPTGQTDN